MLTLRVANVMRNCQAAVIPVSTRLRRAAEALITSETPLLVAVDENSRLAGIVAESAVVRSLLATPAADATVESILSRHVESTRADALLSAVLPLFRSACHTVIPVVDDHQMVVGLLHRRDVVRLLLSDASAAETQTPPPTSPTRPPHFLQPENPERKKQRRPSEEA